MKYEYKNDKGLIIEREFPMSGDIPGKVEADGDLFFRVWRVPEFNISVRSDNYIKKDMEDFSRCKISKGSVSVKDARCGKVQAQLRVDKTGKPEMVYKNNPTHVIKMKPDKNTLSKLGSNMENYLS
jgi:hypothetical protein